MFILLPYMVLEIAFAVGVWLSVGQKRNLRLTAALPFAVGLRGTFLEEVMHLAYIAVTALLILLRRYLSLICSSRL
jgi:hypothetical protein